MIGSLLAGTDESTRRDLSVPGPLLQSVSRHGIGRRDGAAARPTATSRQEVNDSLKLVPEGIEGQVPYKGPVDGRAATNSSGGLRAGMGYTGAKTLEDLRNKAQFIRISPASMRESHAHGVLITRESPNYPGAA
jgi:IMP dehydrogenase